MSFDNWSWKRKLDEHLDIEPGELDPPEGFDPPAPSIALPPVKAPDWSADWPQSVLHPDNIKAIEEHRAKEIDRMAEEIDLGIASMLPPATWRASAWCCMKPVPNTNPLWYEHTIELHHLMHAQAALIMAEARLTKDLGYDFVYITRLRRIPSVPPGIQNESSDLDQFRLFIIDRLGELRLLEIQINNTTLQSIINFARRTTKSDDWKQVAFNKLRDEGYLDV